MPFLDYQPARGLINYFPGLLTELFFDNTFSGQVMTTGVLSSLGILFLFLVLRLWTGNLLAFIVAISLSDIWRTSILVNFHLTFIAGLSLIVLVRLKQTSYTTRFWLASISLPLILLIQLGEGSAVVLGLIPLLLYFFIQSFLHERRKLTYSSLGFILFFFVVYLLFPQIIQIFGNAVFYVMNVGGVNEVAYGTPWYFVSPSITSGLLWQFFRFSWVLSIVPAAFSIVQELRKARTDNSRLLLLLYLVIVAIALIPRSAGRIDPGDTSRPFIASLFFATAGLSVMVTPSLLSQTRKCMFILLMSLIVGIFGAQETSFRQAFDKLTYVMREAPQTVSNTGLSNVGDKVIIDQEQLSRQLAIKRTLDAVLLPTETYYDVTNRNSQYGFQGRPSPVSEPAFYNNPTEYQQQKIIKQLREKNVSLALISANNILHDGGTLPLRAFWVYDYLLSNFVPFRGENNFIWMIRKGEESRLNGTDYKIPSLEEQMLLLDEAFGQYKLAGWPSAWGNSIEILQAKLEDPKNMLDLLRNNNGESLTRSSFGYWEIEGYSPSVAVEFSSDSRVDFIYFETEKNSCDNLISFVWRDETSNRELSFIFQNKSNRYLIPVSVSPYWFNEDLEYTFKVVFNSETSCEVIIKSLLSLSRKLP